MPSNEVKRHKGGRSNWASEDEFETYREIITTMFHNNMTVPDMMETMERKYSFYAT